MLNCLKIVVVFVVLLGAKYSVANEFEDNFLTTSKLYESMLSDGEPNTALLNLFLTKMPKGGDLHHHYVGALYVETFLDWVNNKGWFIDPCSFKIVITNSNRDRASCASSPITINELLFNDALYRKLLTLWSSKDFKNHSHEQIPPDANFFNTFGYFLPVASEYMDVGLQIIKNRAISENVTYIETMLDRPGINSVDYINIKTIDRYNERLRSASTQAQVNVILDEIVDIFMQNQNFDTTIDSFVKRIGGYHQNIDDENFTMRYQTYAVRIFGPVQVFTDLFSGYVTTIKSSLFVGVNIVAPENHHIALKDYILHMRMYNYLKEKYPNVGRALHAGELTLGMVKPEDLLFHIGKAREIADAQRIGHGIDIPYESNSIELLFDMKHNSAVEINLTSNSFILGVENNEHPYLIYANYGVPIVISTDDAGVSRNNLSNEFVLLASRYKPSYRKLKQYVYNSIQYSFLPSEQKAVVKKRLDYSFILFEKDMADLYLRFDL